MPRLSAEFMTFAVKGIPDDVKRSPGRLETASGRRPGNLSLARRVYNK